MEKVGNWFGFPAFDFQSEIKYVLVVLVLVAIVRVVVVAVIL